MAAYRNLCRHNLRLCSLIDIYQVGESLHRSCNSILRNSSSTSQWCRSFNGISVMKGTDVSVRGLCRTSAADRKESNIFTERRTSTRSNSSSNVSNCCAESSRLDSTVASSWGLYRVCNPQRSSLSTSKELKSPAPRCFNEIASHVKSLSCSTLPYGPGVLSRSTHAGNSARQRCIERSYLTLRNEQTLGKQTFVLNSRQRHGSSPFSDHAQRRSLNFWSSSPSSATDLNKAVTEAEKIVGYSTSFLSLRCLLSDELSNVAMQMRKLIGTTHPLLKTARKLFYNGKQGLQTRGLLVLLISKAGGPSPSPNQNNEFMVSGIYPRQRTLAEITEMIHTASLIHKGVVNLSALNGHQSAAAVASTAAAASTDTAAAVASAAAVVLNGTSTAATTYRTDMEFGNKMAVLSGDFLLANASTGLASLRNTKVVEMMSEAIGDLMKAEFTSLRDLDGSHILSPGGATVSDWENQSYLASGSLISHSCASTLMLANHAQPLCDAAFNFGKQISLANQINEELQSLLHGEMEESTDPKRANGGGLTLASLPVILYVQRHNEEPFARALLSGERPPQGKIVKELARHRSELVEEVRSMRSNYALAARNSLSSFTPSSAHKALENIVTAITHV